MRAGSLDNEWREECAPHRALEIFSSKWTGAILYVLDTRHEGCARTGVLQRSLPGISKKMLTQTLREMEANGLVTRRVYGTVPPAVDYTLTPLGIRFVEPVALVYSWGQKNSDALQQLAAHRAVQKLMNNT